MEYAGIKLEGTILSSELIGKLPSEELSCQRPADFGLKPKAILREEIGYAWQTAQNYWRAFQIKRERTEDNESGTTETRATWIIPLLRELGYDLEKSNAEIVHEKSYAISHRDKKRVQFPVHIVGFNQSLDKRAEVGQQLRLSPHGLLQEYLNYTEHLYGIVTNGIHLRLLRDATRLSRLAFVEFNLEKIMEEERYPDFAILYRLLHATRMPVQPEEAEQCILEEYHQESIESGARIREKLREAVEGGMREFANGWLRQPDNHDFIQKVRDGEVDSKVFYERLLKIIYRLLFIVVIEERQLIYPETVQNDEEGISKKDIYLRYYSLRRLQNLALNRQFVDGRKTDLWRSIRATFSLFETAGYGRQLGIEPLGGELFGDKSLYIGGTDLMQLSLDNKAVLEVIGGLTLFENEKRQRVRINYTDLDVEELGSIYEALLDLNPRFYPMETGVGFGFTDGTERKETGSYYTRSDLVMELIKSALDPVILRCLELPSDQAKVEALLNLKVCDPSVGSGHFVLAAARRIAMAIARVRSQEDSPGEAWYRPALREVIQRCIYGVDRNPAAIDLCRLALWLESHNPGKSLSFLEHNIRCGDSLIGIDRMERLEGGIPDKAFNALTGDAGMAAKKYKKINKDFLKSKQGTIYGETAKLRLEQEDFAAAYEELLQQSDETVADYAAKKDRFEQLRNNKSWWTEWMACNLFTYAFFQPLDNDTPEHLVVTSETLSKYRNNPAALHGQIAGQVIKAADHFRFFHWPLEFPEVMAQGGFDVMLGNPPWERIKLQEKEFFATRDEKIANATNKAARNRLINALADTNPELYQDFLDALHQSEASSNYIRNSERYPLTGQGDINTYSIFSEVFKNHIARNGRAGFIVPTGIATDNTNKDYFGELVAHNRLVSLYDFENQKKFFPSVHQSYKFCLLTVSGANLRVKPKAKFGFFLKDVLDLDNELRVFGLTKEDFLNINPNTKTCPIFRTSVDAALTAKIYSRVPVLINEETGQNPWGIKFSTMFHMSGDSHLFRTREEMEKEGFTLMGNRFVKGEEVWLPLYEGKICWTYNHRKSTFGDDYRVNTDTDSFSLVNTEYYVLEEIVKAKSNSSYSFGIRRVARNTDERLIVGSIAPYSGITYGLYLFKSELSTSSLIKLYAQFNSIPFDYFARNATGQPSLTYMVIYQLPVLLESSIPEVVIDRIFLELVYTSWDIKAFADDLWLEADETLRAALRQQWEDNQAATGGHPWEIPDWAPAYPEIKWERDAGCPLPPFKWDEERRARLQAELDAIFAKLYGLTRDELRYILDPADIYGEDFPGETFRVLKKKELKKYGEYRTRRLVLEAWDRLDWIDEKEQAERLKAAWEEYQAEGDAIRAKTAKKKTPAKLSPKPPKAKPAPQASPIEQAIPFPDQSEEKGDPIRIGCKVTLQDSMGTVFHYHVTAHADKGAYTGTYRQISPKSELYILMKGKRVGEQFRHKGIAFTIKDMNIE